MPQSADVFVSYSREDRETVLSLAAKLREAGVSLWIDQGGIDGAAMWSEEIVNALENAKVLLLMISEHAVNSHNVVKEVTLASERKSHILPIHLEPTRIPQGLKYPLAGIQHIEYFQGDQDENLKTIVRSLERVGVTIKPPDSFTSCGSQPAHGPSHSIHSEGPKELRRAIAVLPFENVSPDKETDYFSDGLTEELISSLSKVTGIDVVSRITCMQYKGTKKDLVTIGQELRTRYLMTGSVRKFQENLRINAQLVDVQTDSQLWSETYKGKLDDIFDIQEKVSAQIADALKLKLSFTEKITLTKRSTVNVQAYDLYLRGKDYLYRLSKRNAEYAIQLFEKAIELDPRYAEAYAGCSTAYGMLYQWVSQKEEYKDKAQELSFRSLMYDNNLPEAYAAMGFSYFIWNKYQEAAESSKKAIELDPEDFVAYWILGRIYYSNRDLEKALPLFLKVVELKPSFYVAYPDLKIVYHGLKREREAAEMLDKVLEVLPNYLLQCPDDARARMIYAINLAEAGKKDEALQEGNLALEMSPSDPLMLYNGACLYSQLGETKLSVETLRSAITTGHSNFNWIRNDSDLEPIRNDHEYIELMKGR